MQTKVSHQCHFDVFGARQTGIKVGYAGHDQIQEHDNMPRSTVESEYTFVNLTDNPAKGRDERRTFVRQTVMSDYHKRRRKKDHNPGDTSMRDSPARPTIIEYDRSSCSSGSQTELESEQATNGACRADEAAQGSSVLLGPRSLYLFQPKLWSESESSQISHLIVRFLCGQPIKAAHDLSYAIFVHRHFKDAQHVGAGSSSSSHPLTACAELLHTFVAATPSTSMDYPALWARVHEQQEWIYAQTDNFTKWELLSAAQASSLYMLLWLRLGGSQGHFPDGGLALLYTLGNIFKYLLGRHLKTDAKLIPTMLPPNKWHDWIFQESCLRVSAVYFILAIVVSMDIGLACHWPIERVPLPATKALWEADSEAAWMSVFRVTEGAGDRLMFGDLLVAPGHHRQRAEAWEEEADDLGFIIALASRLHSRV
ncbi:uncharacterized protein B0I36DRAFT_342598 [Microdochium trichocladiopsis]|uniref:Transcription factor domain-containing protein n=1 Tax=Microdochium trichocladiopsis TaxID=1682393 RepID=A0A9P9BH32_9PEZI|nr:uncharacterized protein B0I36DRAFT_342598 [Microdochium trichocladiopsis]KAH7009221.1 hypothetical protein B0I36DRAFT_342598 [Microdochium trichocladiopsis]